MQSAPMPSVNMLNVYILNIVILLNAVIPSVNMSNAVTPSASASLKDSV
jgi:hypothetical protein